MNHLKTIRNLKNRHHGGKAIVPASLIVALTLGSFGSAKLLSAEPTTADPVAAANALSQAFRQI